MELPAGVNLFDLLEQYKSEPNAPKKFEDLAEFEKRALARGFVESAEYIHSWRIFMEYHIYAEWHVPDES